MVWQMRSSNFSRWYCKSTGIILDRLCCCSYLDAQLRDELRSKEYFDKRSTNLPTEWISDEDLIFEMNFREDDVTWKTRCKAPHQQTKAEDRGVLLKPLHASSGTSSAISTGRLSLRIPTCDCPLIDQARPSNALLISLQ